MRIWPWSKIKDLEDQLVARDVDWLNKYQFTNFLVQHLRSETGKDYVALGNRLYLLGADLALEVERPLTGQEVP